MLSGDVVYTYANLQGEDAADPYFVPPGWRPAVRPI